MSTRSFLLTALVVLSSQLEERRAWAEDGVSSNQATQPASSALAGPESSASTSTPSPTTSEGLAPATSAPTPETSTAESKASPSQIKWRPLVLRSEIPPDQRPIFGSFKGNYLMAGANVGLGLTKTSLILGGELSFVHQTTEFAWFGAYVDGVHDFAREQTRFSVGPEVGWSAFGLDAGYLLLDTPVGVAHGITVRPLVTMGYVTVFGRLSKELSINTRVWSELGLLLKYPIEL